MQICVHIFYLDIFGDHWHYLHMFGGHWSNASEEMKYLICHMTSENHVIEGSISFMSGTSSWHVTTLPGLLAIGIK